MFYALLVEAFHIRHVLSLLPVTCTQTNTQAFSYCIKKADIALHGKFGNPISKLRDVTCHMGSHSVTCHPTRVNAPRLTKAIPGGIEGWVDLVDLITPRPGVEPVTFRSRVRRQTAAPPRQQYVINSTKKLKVPTISITLSDSSVTLGSVLISVYMAMSQQWAADTAQLCGW